MTRVIRQKEIVFDLRPGGGIKVELIEENDLFVLKLDEHVNHQATVTISVVEWI